MAKIKRLRLDVQSIVSGGLFRGKKPEISFHSRNSDGSLSNLPDDVKLHFMTVDPVVPGFLYVYLESDEWPDVESYQNIGDIPIVITTYYPNVGEPLSLQSSAPLKQQQKKNLKTPKSSKDTIEPGEEPSAS